MPILECQNVTKSFGGLKALSKVSISVQNGELLGVIGPNGSGKTTLFNCISGFYKPDSGRIIYDGRDIAGQRPHKICRLGIGRTFQLVRPFLDMTVLENVKLGQFFGRNSKEGISLEPMKTLELVGLSKSAESLASSLTTNDRKKLELARALAGSPRLLLLDEIITGLTPAESNELIKLIMEIKERYVEAILMVEHIMKVIMNVSDSVAVLDHGELLAYGKPSEVSREASVIEAYLGKSRGLKAK